MQKSDAETASGKLQGVAGVSGRGVAGLAEELQVCLAEELQVRPRSEPSDEWLDSVLSCSVLGPSWYPPCNALSELGGEEGGGCGGGEGGGGGGGGEAG